jgi:E3 ubiquitin-protein ligase synoviolin
MDILFLHHTIAATLDQKGHSVQLLFAFEYIILASTAAATLLKYLLSMLDSAMEGRWEGKGTYVFYLELLKDMMHLFVYCIFFVIVFSNYGLPLHLVRTLEGTAEQYVHRCCGMPVACLDVEC